MKKTPQDKAMKRLVSETHKRTSADLIMTLSNSGVQIRSRTVYWYRIGFKTCVIEKMEADTN